MSRTGSMLQRWFGRKATAVVATRCLPRYLPPLLGRTVFARILTVVDQFTRECVALEADRSITGMTVVHVLESSMEERGSLPESITLNNGSEFCSRALEAWAMRNEVQLCIIRLDRPVENGFIESLNGRLRKACLNVEWLHR